MGQDVVPEQLEPRLEYLEKEYVLVQAWKKTSNFIRSRNWFYDALDLDRKTIELPEFLSELTENIANPQDWKRDPLRLIPAPKNQSWQVSDAGDWGPKCRTDVPLRPLAHASLRDQVTATAIMLCIANRVETTQGDPRKPVDNEANRRQISSYGNRLFCRERNGELQHSWGSKGLYRSYYTDFQTFVERPMAVAAKINRYGKRLFNVHTDLSQFYDRVRPCDLTRALERFCKVPSDKPFFDFAGRFFDWGWEDEAAEFVTEYSKLNEFPEGTFRRVALPQGLTASGFFANVVMIGFDKRVRDKVGNEIAAGIVLEDGCRYVDDMRFVVSTERGLDKEKVEGTLLTWIQGLLEEEKLVLKVSEDKTRAAEFPGSKPAMIRRSPSIKRVQTAISGGLDVETAIEVIDMLQGLMRSSRDTSRASWRFSPVPDVRDETVWRFSAWRYRNTFRSLRPLLQDDRDLESENDNTAIPLGIVMSQKELDEIARPTALELVERWVEDPANVRLLLIAFDLWPNPQILEEVLNILKPFTELEDRCLRQRQVAWYCLSELLRAGATETGIVEDYECLPADADLAKYLKILQEEALRLVGLPVGKIPWYLKQKAYLFVAVHAPLSISIDELDAQGECRFFQQAILFRQGKYAGLEDSEFATLAVLVRRAFADCDSNAGLIRKVLTDAIKEEIAKRDAAFCLELSRGDERFFDNLPLSIQRSLCSESSGSPGNTKSLAGIILAPEPEKRYKFRNELSLLQFSNAFLEVIKTKQETIPLETIEPGQVFLCMDEQGEFSSIEQVNESICLGDADHSLYRLPSWCQPKEHWRIQLGYLLRFILTQEEDFTSVVGPRYSDEPPIRYRPVQSHWLQRVYGLYNAHDGFGDGLLPISDWLVEFLLALLHWPGAQTPKSFAWVNEGIDKAKSSISARICKLENRRGKSSNTLMLNLNAGWPTEKLKMRPLRGCVIQTVLPSEADFQLDPTVSQREIRKKHRRHISAALATVKRMLALRGTYGDGGRELDWLILPELSVHPQDVKTHLVQFAQQHKTLILAGLTYQKDPPTGQLTNSAIWVIPEWTEEHGLQPKIRLQGKLHLGPDARVLQEQNSLLSGIRPCQWLVEYPWSEDSDQDLLRLTASICYDATDLGLMADLKGLSDILAIPALNKDVKTFDNMALALHYHLFQLVVIVNNGKYGGSSAYWPKSGKEHEKQLFHLHGQPQTGIAFFEVSTEDIASLKQRWIQNPCQQNEDSGGWKTPPAGSYQKI